MTGERNKLIWGEIVARAWRDEAFKQQLLADPKVVLTEAGMSVPDGVELQVVQDTPTLRYLVLPNSPVSGEQGLSEEQLELISGGSGDATTVTTAELQTAVVTVVGAVIAGPGTAQDLTLAVVEVAGMATTTIVN